MATVTRPAPAGRRSPAHRASGRDYWSLTLRAVLVLGWALRIRQYAFRRSLWDDEASIALNITHRGYLSLTHPLNILQGAPFGWLWLERACYQVLGNGEYQLRLPALAGGLLLVWWTFCLVRRHLSGPAGVVALLLVAVSPSLVYFASEVKPYGVDAAAAVGLLVVASRVDRSTVRGALVFGAASAAAILFSFPSLYVSAAVYAVAVILALRRRHLRLLGAWVAGGVACLALFGLQYLRALEPTAHSAAMKSYWAAGYPPRPLTVSGFVTWLARDGFAVGRYPVNATVPVLALVALVAGLVALRRRGRGTGTAWLAGVVALIVGFVVVGAVLAVYPMRDRMVLFALPLVMVGAAASIDGLRRPALRAVAAVAVIAAWAGILPRAAVAVAAPYNHTEFRAALVYAHDHERPGDRIWADVWANSLYAYYGPLLHIPIQAHFQLTPSACAQPPDGRSGPYGLSGLVPGTRVWVIFATPPDVGIDIPLYLHAFSQLGRLDLWKPTSVGAGVASFTVAAHPPARITSPIGCLRLTPPAAFD